MTHECDECGQEFDTLSRLRLHECPGEQFAEATDDPTTDTTDESTGSPVEESDLDRQEIEREYPEVV